LSIFVFILFLLASFFNIIYFKTYDNIFSLLLLNNIGLTLKDGNINGIGWFVSVLFWVSIFYYYIFSIIDKKYLKLIVPLIVALSYSLILHSKGGYIWGHVENINLIFNVGVLRGLGGMGLGLIIAKLYKDYKPAVEKLELNIFQKLLVTGAEGYLIGFLINNMALRKLHYNNDFIFVIAFCVLIILFLAKKGYISKLFECNFSSFLGKYAFSIYMVSHIISLIIVKTIWVNHREFVLANLSLSITLTTLTIVLSGILAYHIIEKPCAQYLAAKKF